MNLNLKCKYRLLARLFVEGEMEQKACITIKLTAFLSVARGEVWMNIA